MHAESAKTQKAKTISLLFIKSNKLKFALFIAFLLPQKLQTLISLVESIFSVNDSTFHKIALEVFKYQYEHVEIYRLFCNSLGKNPGNVNTVLQIPFLPIEFFKSHAIITEGHTAQAIFESSGTTGSVSSKHFVADTKLYERSFISAFEKFYGPAADYVYLALLPSYLERNNSSLVYMAQKLMDISQKNANGFFLDNTSYLYDLLEALKAGKRKTVLLGVTFALLDFAVAHKTDFPDLIIMETGGMKGRREEMTRAEVHSILKTSFGVSNIHSEYGMTEMLSQAYSKGNGIFYPCNTLKILIRDLYDPMQVEQNQTTGGVNIIDLANLYSCSFIATGDLGKLYNDGSFEILGRMAQTDVRGCNLMVV